MTTQATRSMLLGLLLAIALAFPVPSAQAAATADTDTGLPVRTAQEVAEMWQTLMNPQSDIDDVFKVAPQLTTPYAPGTLRADYLQDGLNAVNFYRFISGFPADIRMTDELNRKAAYGSLLLAATGEFSHEPPQPGDMSDHVYAQGYDSTTSANIYMSYGYRNHVLVASINAYMEDTDIYNLSVLGHRRWILNPPLQFTGFGLTKDARNYSYAAMQVFDENRPETIDYRYVPYPACGAFPVEVMNDTTAWSVSVNPDKYATPSARKVTVTLKRTNDNKTWQFRAGTNRVSESGKYFNVETSRYGSGPAIIFRPDRVGEYRPGDQYEVRIEGLEDVRGNAATISYTVKFVSAANPEESDQTGGTSDINTADDGAEPGAAIRFADTATHWARHTIEWAAERGIVSGFPNGTFQPDGTVTEEQFLLMFTVAMHAKLEPAGHWSDVYYRYAAEQGFTLAGLVDEDARSQPIDRTAVAELFASGAGHKITGDAAIRFMLDNGYSRGKTAATVQGYHGADTLTRAEAVQFIRNALDANYAIAR